MYLEIITPSKKVFEGEVDSVQMPGSQGGFEVLNNHAALISSLEKGKIVVRGKNGQTLTIDGGIVEVKNNKVVILAESLLVD